MIVACVRIGTKYGAEYVERLRDGVVRYLSQPHHFVCLTDRVSDLPTSIDVQPIAIPDNYAGWWGKMVLFERSWRLGQKVIYFDLDTVIIGDLSPLADIAAPLAVCANFTQLAGHSGWPCRYGSCVMVIGPEFDNAMWNWFSCLNEMIVRDCGRYGDQMAIEKWDKELPLLQDYLPKNFFIGYRDFTEERPQQSSIAVFAGSHKPGNSLYAWVREAWVQ